MNDNDGFDLPPGDVTNNQLYVLVVLLRKDVLALRVENVALRAENAELREEVAELKQSFDNAKAVTSSVKWMAGIATAIVGLYGAIRTYFS